MNPFTTLILFPFQPRRVALAHARSSMGRVYLIHLLGVVLLGLLGVGGGILDSLSGLMRVDVRMIVLGDWSAAIVLAVFAGECVFVAVATVMACWAGGDEPVADSWRHALRVSWLYAASLWWVAAALILLLWVCNHWRRNPSTIIGAIGLFAAVIVWSIVSYLRALTVERPQCGEDTDPMCEWCGYNLSHLDATSVCPECGRSIAASVNSGERKSLAFDDIGWSHVMASLVKPEPMFRSITGHARSSCAFSLLAVSLIATIVTAGGGFVGTAIVIQGLSRAWNGLLFLIVALFVGLFVSWCLFIFASGAASLIGFVTSRRVGRNRFVAAFQIVALTGWVLPLWAGIAMSAYTGMTMSGAGNLVGGWFVANLIVAALYIRAGMKRMTYLQYANR